LLSHLLDVIFDKSHDGRVRIVYKELFLVLAHGVGESVTMHKAFVTANCKYPYVDIHDNIFFNFNGELSLSWDPYRNNLFPL
jgi:hypothetical protein